MTTEILDTRREDARACFVPISKLTIHSGNVRRTDKRADIEALAASIAAHGLLQNLSVVRSEDGRYAVVAGARRLAALRLLAKQRRIARDFPAPCTIVEASIGAEASLAENVQRVAMNAMDEMEAFAGLVDDGMSVEEVAARFGVSVRHVEQRMALGRLSPKLRAAYRKEEITLDVARAFCLSDDIEAQERLFKQFGKPITHAPSVRAALAGGRIPATDKLARFVGVEAYEAAGGRLIRDLFEDSGAFLEDGDILQRLASERMETLRQELVSEGWGWAEVQFSYGQIEGCASERLRPVSRPLSDEEEAAASSLEAEIAALDQQLEACEDDDALWRRRDDAEAKLDALKQSTQTFDPDLMARAGAVIAIDHTGAPVITRGLIKRADAKTVRKLQKATEKAADDESGADAAEEIAAPAGPRLPKKLIEEITRARTRAIRDLLAKTPHVALALVVHTLQQRSAASLGVPGVEIASRPVGYEDVDAFERRRVALSEAAVSEDLTVLIAAPNALLCDKLAVFAAETLDFAHQGASVQDSKLQAMSDALASALDLDMSRYWDADSDFWERAPKAFIIEALAATAPIAEMSEAARKVRLAALAKLKKTELASMAAKTLQSSGWLPDELITPPRAGALALTPRGEAAIGGAAADAA